MPWCPRCDETFPQGPSCPRCSTRLVSRDHDHPEPSLESMPELQSIRVSRRHRRALERMSGPRPPSSRPLIFALVLLVFASGFLLGRVGTMNSVGPAVRSLPLTDPLTFEGISGHASYVVSSGDGLITLARHDLFSGDVVPRARLDTPISGPGWSTQLVSAGGAVAAVVTDESRDAERGYVALAPPSGPVHGWIPGVEAAWESRDRLVVRSPDGTLTLWTLASGDIRSAVIGRADGLHQTSSGIALRRGLLLEDSSGSPERTLELPPDVRVIAVAGDLSRAVIDTGEPKLWDGSQITDVRVEGMTVSGAAFDPSGERVAMVLKQGDRVRLAIVDDRGNASLKPLGGRASCAATPAWGSSGRWVYVATGDGHLYAAESGGGAIESVRTRAVGCGLAWLDTS